MLGGNNDASILNAYPIRAFLASRFYNLKPEIDIKSSLSLSFSKVMFKLNFEVCIKMILHLNKIFPGAIFNKSIPRVSDQYLLIYSDIFS